MDRLDFPFRFLYCECTLKFYLLGNTEPCLLMMEHITQEKHIIWGDFETQFWEMTPSSTGLLASYLVKRMDYIPRTFLFPATHRSWSAALP